MSVRVRQNLPLPSSVPSFSLPDSAPREVHYDMHNHSEPLRISRTCQVRLEGGGAARYGVEWGSARYGLDWEGLPGTAWSGGAATYGLEEEGLPGTAWSRRAARYDWSG